MERRQTLPPLLAAFAYVSGFFYPFSRIEACQIVRWFLWFGWIGVLVWLGVVVVNRRDGWISANSSEIRKETIRG